MTDLIGKMVVLVRDCEASLIPHGTPILLEKDTEVSITQALGGSYTVLISGNLARIEGSEADALGLEADHSVSDILRDDALDATAKTWALLRTCYDPEIPVNVVDLGLVYGVNNLKLPSGESRMHIVMTLTSPTCGMGPIITDDIKRKINDISGVKDVIVELVFDPPWSQEMMTESARLHLGLL